MSMHRYDNSGKNKSSLITTSLSSNPNLKSVASYAILIACTSAMLTGCQSNPISSEPAASLGSSIDFNNADLSQSRAQSRAFNASLNDSAERYDKLFDQSKYPDTQNQAKTRLLRAIRQHLDSEHVAVAQANYQTVPFVQSDSIDAGSDSLLKTLLEAYFYEPESVDDTVYDDASDASDETDFDDAIAIEEIESTDDTDQHYDEYGYDEYGYDEYGYDEYGYDEYGYDEYGYDEYGYDEYGENKSGDIDEEGTSKLSGLNPKVLITNYEARQLAKQQSKSNNNNETPTQLPGMLSQVLSMFQRTPEQIEALNTYQYKNLTFNSVSQYKPQVRQLQSIYSYDYLTPTISASIQIPLAFDFDNSLITIDPSAVMPLVALASPEDTPLPDQMTSHTVNFGLPESVTSQLPPAVVYDAVISAIQDSMAELPAEHFSAIDISGDQFAQQVGADSAVKIYFGSQQSGVMLGKTLKYVSQSLENYVDANPSKYPDDAKLKQAIKKIQLYNKGYQSSDVGALLQIIEAIGPISFNQVNYYYLNNSGRLVAKQQRVNVGGDLLGEQISMLNRIRYDDPSFDKHPLTPLLQSSFGPNARPVIDGNGWISEKRERNSRLETARNARYDYDYNGTDDASNDDSDYSDDISDAVREDR